MHCRVKTSSRNSGYNRSAEGHQTAEREIVVRHQDRQQDETSRQGIRQNIRRSARKYRQQSEHYIYRKTGLKGVLFF